jgi:hypothetical protein
MVGDIFWLMKFGLGMTSGVRFGFGFWSMGVINPGQW